MWLTVGYAVASLFPSPAPVAGILVGACADPAASWVGEAGTRTGTKTWRGSAAHLVTAVAVLQLGGVSWAGSIVAAVIGTIVERYPGPFNDNLVVAPAVAVSVSLLA
jgi:dolichol kinase